MVPEQTEVGYQARFQHSILCLCTLMNTHGQFVLPVIFLLGDLFAVPGCQAYPQLFAAKHAKTSCIDHPSKFQQYGHHGRLVLDR